MKKNYIFLSLFIVGLFVSGCGSLSTFQNAEVTPTGKAVIGGGVNGIVNTIGGISDEGESSMLFPVPEIYGRYGLAKDWDAGIKYTLPLTISGDIKYQLIDGPVAVAFNPGCSMFIIGGYGIILKF